MRPLALARDQALADGVAHEVGERARVDLPHRVRPVRLDGRDADEEPGRGFSYRRPLTQKLHDLTFPTGERGGPRLVRAQSRGDHLRDRRGEIALAAGG